MGPVSHTVIQSVPVPIERVFALLTDLGRMAEWLPGCAGTESDKPLRKGVRFKVRFGQRQTEFEVVDFAPPTTFGWVERGERNGWKTFFRLDQRAESTAVTVRDVWAPRSLIAWLRGRLFEKRRVDTQLEKIVANLRKILAP
jgi:uncharacterized protein YndB with AHSA1/START domain